jgi:Fe-S-cluster containining protein
MDIFRVNRETAYRGQVGLQRKGFCANYIARKRTVIDEMTEAQHKEAQTKGERITCTEGCSFCCLLHVEATIQECEAIVYYLYQNEDALKSFLDKYPPWRNRIRENGDMFKELADLSREVFSFQFGHRKIGADYVLRKQEAFSQAQSRYAMQKMYCPFLDDNLCTIYPVRPYNCAGFFATTPPAWCDPSKQHEPKIYRSNLPSEAILNLNFYYKSLKAPVFTFMPLAVYEILSGGYGYLSTIPGFENLEDEFLKDPEVKSYLDAYAQSRQKIGRL